MKHGKDAGGERKEEEGDEDEEEWRRETYSPAPGIWTCPPYWGGCNLSAPMSWSNLGGRVLGSTEIGMARDLRVKGNDCYADYGDCNPLPFPSAQPNPLYSTCIQCPGTLARHLAQSARNPIRILVALVRGGEVGRAMCASMPMLAIPVPSSTIPMPVLDMFMDMFAMFIVMPVLIVLLDRGGVCILESELSSISSIASFSSKRVGWEVISVTRGIGTGTPLALNNPARF